MSAPSVHLREYLMEKKKICFPYVLFFGGDFVQC